MMICFFIESRVKKTSRNHWTSRLNRYPSELQSSPAHSYNIYRKREKICKGRGGKSNPLK